MSQLTVEFRMLKDARNDWYAQHTGIADIETAKSKAVSLWESMTRHKGAGSFEMRICETPFGKVLATVEDGVVVPRQAPKPR